MFSEPAKKSPHPIRFIRLKDVVDRTGLSEITIYRMEQEALFPQRRKIGKHAVAWVEAEVDEWCADRAAGTPFDGGPA